MGLETFALIDSNNQVVNHVVVDKESDDFEKVIADQLTLWGCVRYVETDVEKDIIILDPSPEIWTIHTEEDGFILPEISVENTVPEETVTPVEEVTINGRIYPVDSRLIKENAHLRPEGWVLPEFEVEVSLKDAD